MLNEVDRAKKLCQKIYNDLNWLVTACDGMESIYTRSTIRQDFFDTALASAREVVNEVKLNGGIDETIGKL